MKKLFFAATLGILITAQNAFAFDPAQLKQYLDTKSCEGCDLRDAVIKNMNMSGSFLKNADLSGADLSSSRFDNSDFFGAKLVGANLFGINSTDVDFSGADLSKAKFLETAFRKSNFEKTMLMNLDNAIISGSGSNFNNSVWTGTTLNYLYTKNATFDGADLRGINFPRQSTEITFAKMTNANLDDAAFVGVNLTGVSFLGSSMVGTNLTGAIFCRTTLPDGTIKGTC